MGSDDIVMDRVDDLQKRLLLVARETQQNYYELCSDWNRYKKEELYYLHDFIGYALFGPPLCGENDDFHYDPEKQVPFIDKIYDKVIECGSSEDPENSILCSIIYNVIFNEEKSKQDAEKKIAEAKAAEEAKAKEKTTEGKTSEEKKAKEKDEDNVEPELQVYPVPIFKVKSWKPEVEKNAERIVERIETIYYIDNTGRVYIDFLDYLNNNTLPECTMVLPKDGRYQMDPASFPNMDLMATKPDEILTKVWLEIVESPASNFSAKLLAHGDIVTAVAGVASICVGVAALLTPIGAPIAVAAAVSSGVSGLWSVGRSAQQLADRGQHGESINITNREALGAWIGVAGGTMGLAASGGGALLTRAVRTGASINSVAKLAHDAVLIGNIVINGVGIGFRSCDIIFTLKNDGEVSPRDIFFLTAHILFFCNSVINAQLAENLIKSSQGQMLKDYEDSLRSNRHRNEFQRMARNTRAKFTDDVTSNKEIIRGINNIDDKDAFFASMVRNRKSLSAFGAKASFSDGEVVINGVLKIDPKEFSNLPKNVRADIVKSVSSVPTNPRPIREVYTPNEVSYKNFVSSSNNDLKKFCQQHSSAIPQNGKIVIVHFSKVLQDLQHVENGAEIFLKLLDMGYKILRRLSSDEKITLGDALAYIVQFLWDYVKSNMRQMRPSCEFEDPLTQKLLDELITQLMLIIEKKIDEWVQAFKIWLQNEFPNSLFITD